MPDLDQRLLADPRLRPSAAVQRQAQSFRVLLGVTVEYPLCAGISVSVRPTGVERCFARPRLLRFHIPLATSPLEFGLPGFTTPGIFRPWPFSALRRFAPPDGSSVLFHTDTTYGIQRTQTIRCFPCGPDRSILGTVPSGITRLGHADNPKVPARFRCVARNDDQLLLTRRSRRAMRRRVTHRVGCKQPIREEGTPTCTDVQTDHKCRTPSPAATAPTARTTTPPL